MMKNIFFTVLIINFIIFSFSLVYATPIPWFIDEGGNGHYYELINENSDWWQAKTEAESMGGYLATITSQEENNWIANTFDPGNPYTPWIGGYQDTSDSDYSEPSGGWKWITGELWNYTNWYPGEPNNLGLENHLQLYPQGCWNDEYGGKDWHVFLVEWDSNPVPEPATCLLLGFSLLGIIGYRRGRKHI